MIHQDSFRGCGIRYACIPLAELQAVKDDYKRQCDSSSVYKNETLKSYIDYITFDIPDSSGWERGLVIMAIACPARSVEVRWQGKSARIIQPPQYYQRELKRAEITEYMLGRFKAAGASKLEDVHTMPMKHLAAWSGLGKYGRNNIVNVEGLGTALSLMAFWTDLDKASMYTQKLPGPAFLDACGSCTLCTRLCPTKAVPQEKGVIDATRCLSLFNEVEGEMPDWIPPDMHNSCVGCVICQEKCPVNAAFTQSMLKHPDLSESDTGLLLKGEENPETFTALERFMSLQGEDMLKAYLPVVKRNLSLFIKAKFPQAC